MYNHHLRYNYLNPQEDALVIPSYLEPLLRKLEQDQLGRYDQLIISEYQPGIGLKPHIDRSLILSFLYMF